MAFEPKNLTELLEWRQSLPGWQWRPSWDYLKELQWLCHEGRIEVPGRRVLNGLDLKVGDQQPVPTGDFSDYRLGQEAGTDHGELRGRLSVLIWVDLRFPDDTHQVWEVALKTGEIIAPRAASPLAETVLIPAVPAGPASASVHPPLPNGLPPQPEKAKAEPRPGTKAWAFMEWYREEYSEGHPVGTPLKTLAEQFRQAKGLKQFHDDTARRALGLK